LTAHLSLESEPNLRGDVRTAGRSEINARIAASMSGRSCPATESRSTCPQAVQASRCSQGRPV